MIMSSSFRYGSILELVYKPIVFNHGVSDINVTTFLQLYNGNHKTRTNLQTYMQHVFVQPAPSVLKETLQKPHLRKIALKPSSIGKVCAPPS